MAQWRKPPIDSDQMPNTGAKCHADLGLPRLVNAIWQGYLRGGGLAWMGHDVGFAGPGRILAAGEVGEAGPTARTTPVPSEMEPRRMQDLTKRVFLPGAIDSPENQALPSVHLQRGALALLAANSDRQNHAVLAAYTRMRIRNCDTKFLLSRTKSGGEGTDGLRPISSTLCLCVGQRARSGNPHAAEFIRGRYPSRAVCIRRSKNSVVCRTSLS
jgi:hypothetical protein